MRFQMCRFFYDPFDGFRTDPFRGLLLNRMDDALEVCGIVLQIQVNLVLFLVTQRWPTSGPGAIIEPH